MNPKVTVAVSGGRCLLSGVLDFNTTRAALDDIKPVIAQQKSVQIDLAAIISANSAGLALLVECRALATAHQHEVQFSGIPEGLLQLAHVCEVDGLI